MYAAYTIGSLEETTLLVPDDGITVIKISGSAVNTQKIPPNTMSVFLLLEKELSIMPEPENDNTPTAVAITELIIEKPIPLKINSLITINPPRYFEGKKYTKKYTKKTHKDNKERTKAGSKTRLVKKSTLLAANV